MIKKFLTVLVLGLAVFAVSCSKDVSQDELNSLADSSRSILAVAPAATADTVTVANAKSAVVTAVNAAITDGGLGDHIKNIAVADVDFGDDVTTLAGPTDGVSDPVSISYDATVTLTANETDGKTSKLASETIVVEFVVGTLIADTDINIVTVKVDGELDAFTITAGVCAAGATVVEGTFSQTETLLKDAVEDILKGTAIDGISSTVVVSVEATTNDTATSPDIADNDTATATLTLSVVEGDYLFSDNKATKDITIALTGDTASGLA